MQFPTAGWELFFLTHKFTVYALCAEVIFNGQQSVAEGHRGKNSKRGIRLFTTTYVRHKSFKDDPKSNFRFDEIGRWP